MLGFPPVPVRSSLTNLLVQDSSWPSMLMPTLVRTPSQHELDDPRPPKLTSALCLASQKQDYRTLPNIPADHSAKHQAAKLSCQSLAASHLLAPFHNMTPWRNGSASDSRSVGCVFESRRGHQVFVFILPEKENICFNYK